jgi:hypothetical protein
MTQKQLLIWYGFILLAFVLGYISAKIDEQR